MIDQHLSVKTITLLRVSVSGEVAMDRSVVGMASSSSARAFTTARVRPTLQARSLRLRGRNGRSLTTVVRAENVLIINTKGKAHCSHYLFTRGSTCISGQWRDLAVP